MKTIKLTNEQEAKLIQFAINILLGKIELADFPDSNSKPRIKRRSNSRKKNLGPKGYKWTAAHRRNYNAALKRIKAEKEKNV